MPILNYFCNGCTKVGVCSWNKVVEKFSEEKKNPIGITIEIKTCDEYEAIQCGDNEVYEDDEE